MEDVWLRGKQAGHPRKLSKYDHIKIILLKRVGHHFSTTLISIINY